MIKIFSLVAAAILILAACAQGGGSGVPDQAAGEGIDVHYIVTETETEELEIIDDEIAHEDFLTLEEEYNFGEENDFIEFYEPEKIDLTADDSLNETQEAEEEFHALEEEFFTPEDGLTTIDDGFLSDETYDDVFGNFVYEKVVNLEFKDAFKDVMYHPSGGYALIITAESKVLKFDPETKNLSLAADLKPVTLERIAFHPSGEYALIAGYASSQGRLIKITENGNGDFVTETIADASKDGALFRSVRFRQ
ncbi:MAG: hypothetical protein FJ088_12835, partial [Deltaproteobacteria bacterium]|nr:hypothetical protein [Deltaproteobacteria bacterium]